MLKPALSGVVLFLSSSTLVAEQPGQLPDYLLLELAGRTLTGLRIEGPNEVPEGLSEFYTIIAEFDDGFEFDVTYSASKWMMPGLYAEIDVFAELTALEVPSNKVETINSQFTFGTDTETATKDVMITAEESIGSLPIDRIKPNGRLFITPFAPYPNNLTDKVRVFSRNGDLLEVFLNGLGVTRLPLRGLSSFSLHQ